VCSPRHSPKVRIASDRTTSTSKRREHHKHCCHECRREVAAPFERRVVRRRDDNGPVGYPDATRVNSLLSQICTERGSCLPPGSDENVRGVMADGATSVVAALIRTELESQPAMCDSPTRRWLTERSTIGSSIREVAARRPACRSETRRLLITPPCSPPAR
jgi:hypothetical protein